MSKDNAIDLKKPEAFVADPITELIRNGAKQILVKALEAEISIFINHYKELTDELSRRRIVRNGYLPEREIQTGIGPVAVKVPRVRDRSGHRATEIAFSSNILPPYLRRTKSMEHLIPWLYLKGVSTGDFTDALAALIGKDAPGFSAATISRLKTIWEKDFRDSQRRDLSNKQYVYFWVDGIHFNVRMDAKQCLLVIIGATADGKKELVAIDGGFRQSELSWKELLVNIQSRGLHTGASRCVGDGALGFWKAISQVYPDSRWQR